MKNTEQEEIYLTTAYNNNEANILTGLLEANGIPVIIKNKGAGGLNDIILGMSIGTIEIYVPTELLEDAKSIIKIDENYVPETYKQPEVKKTFTWVIFSFLVPIVLTFIIEGAIIIFELLLKNIR